MSKNNKTLVVVESPNKIKKIQSYLGNNYIVKATCGIILDLDQFSMSIDFDNNFEPIYKTSTEGRKSSIIADLKREYKNASDILLATDKDREGEMIAWSVAYILKVKNPKRIVFTAITKKDITDAVKNPSTINYNMVNAQKARRILDRIVGFEVSPLLKYQLTGFKNALSAGRVQSVVVRIIVDLEDEIKELTSTELGTFFRCNGIFKNKKSDLRATLYNIKDNAISKLTKEEDVKRFYETAMQSEYKVAEITEKNRSQNPAVPFETATLQQEANKKFGFTSKRTMDAAQKLYEEGLITYMRTDSVNLSDEALKNISDYVMEKYGKDYYRRMEYKTKTKNVQAQEAHEAIRPTDVFTLVATGPKINADEKRLYELIWKRTVASQMQPAEFTCTNIKILISKNKEYYFLSSLEKMKFDGYLIIYNIQEDQKDQEDPEDPDVPVINANVNIPKKGEKLDVKSIICNQDFVRPPTRYNEGSLIKKMGPKNLNIGRPSTYASIIEKIISRNYVEKKDIIGIEKQAKTFIWKNTPKTKNKLEEETKSLIIGKEKNKFVPTALGYKTNEFLVAKFPTIMDYKFTADMEKKLDKIAKGKDVWNDVIRVFYDEFHPIVLKCIQEKPAVKATNEKILGTDDDGNKITAVMTKYGPAVKKIITDTNDTFYASLEEPVTIENVTLDQALDLLKYPIVLGTFDKKSVILKKGKFGLYISWNNCNISLDSKTNNNNSDDLDLNAELEADLQELLDKENLNIQITLNDAIKYINAHLEKDNNKKIFKDKTSKYEIVDGKFGKYIRISSIKTGKSRNVKLPKNIDMDNITLGKVQEITKKKT